MTLINENVFLMLLFTFRSYYYAFTFSHYKQYCVQYCTAFLAMHYYYFHAFIVFLYIELKSQKIGLLIQLLYCVIYGKENEA